MELKYRRLVPKRRPRKYQSTGTIRSLSEFASERYCVIAIEAMNRSGVTEAFNAKEIRNGRTDRFRYSLLGRRYGGSTLL
jgi:hypothetical protein